MVDVLCVVVVGTPWENSLSELGAKCSGVVVCRSSPSQKAAIVKIMTVCLSLHGTVLKARSSV